MLKKIPDKSKSMDSKSEGDNYEESLALRILSDVKESGGYIPELSYKNWIESQKNLRWDSTPQGRAAIRLFSRGGLGAAAFAFGSWYAGRGRGMAGYSSELKFSEISKDKPLQHIAKIIDTVVGRPIKFTAKMFGASEETAEKFVRFRPTNNITRGVVGRSLGHESVSITFDFFCSSIGDAIGRDIANLADPNVKHDWKDAKGDVIYSRAAKNFGKSLWRYISYNGGEDWAVAVPYAYLMRAQRRIINHFSPGFILDSERGLNGGSFKVDQKGRVVGNYNLEGMLDLQGRFTAYNIGTLMYRELYNNVADKIAGKKVSLYGSPSENNYKKQGFLHEVGDVFKWGARSAVKGAIYMTPATPFFSIFRVPQSKYKGLFINPELEAVLGYQVEGHEYDAMHAHELRRSHGRFNFEKGLPDVYFRKMGRTEKGFKTVSDPIVKHPLYKGYFDAFGQKEDSRVLNQIGKMQNKVRSFANDLPKKLGLSHPSRVNMDNYVNAAFSYTPYMYAKGEAARLWDNGRMDAAAERMIDGAASFNVSEFKAGASEVWRSILHKPFADPAREAYAKKRIAEDNSPPDNLTREQGKLAAAQRIYDDSLTWQQRIVHGNKPDKAEEKIKSEKRSSFQEQEEMRKVLSELQPPTNSIH